MKTSKLKKKPKLFIQFNEANFDLINRYISKYEFNGFKNIINDSTKLITSSEKNYEDLEPWIQWYSFYSNKTLLQHQTFHLGDCLKKNHSLFPEKVSDEGAKVGVFGAMNLPPYKNYNIYIPDAWTNAKSDASFSSRVVTSTLKKIINSNANLSISYKQLIGLFLLIGIPKSLKDVKMIFMSLKSFILKSRENLASFFDYFFINYSLRRICKNELEVNFIFLNGFAHIQHHYLLSSEFINGENPNWYVKNKKDPILNSLKIYDEMFQSIYDKYIAKFEIWIMTGMTQAPFEIPQIYWRFKDHNKLLTYFLSFTFKVNKRMTRDFEIVIENKKDHILVEKFLNEAKIKDSKNNYSNAFGFIDSIDPYTIFASFIYDLDDLNVHLIYNDISISMNDKLDFIAIKNGGHNQKGWVFTNSIVENKDQIVPIWDLSKLIFRNK